MLKAALVLNPASVILFSSKNPAHMQANVALASDDFLRDAIAKAVGYSRRTIQRRLVETRKRLGVATNVEALIVVGVPVGTWDS